MPDGAENVESQAEHFGHVASKAAQAATDSATIEFERTAEALALFHKLDGPLSELTELLKDVEAGYEQKLHQADSSCAYANRILAELKKDARAIEECAKDAIRRLYNHLKDDHGETTNSLDQLISIIPKITHKQYQILGSARILENTVDQLSQLITNFKEYIASMIGDGPESYPDMNQDGNELHVYDEAFRSSLSRIRNTLNGLESEEKDLRKLLTENLRI